MRKYLLRRLLFLLFSLVLATVTLFILLRILPGDPANALLPIGATPDQIAAAQHQVGSDLPIFLQFIHWVKDLASFHFGTSLISSIPVAPEISSRLSLTIPLTLAAFLVAVIVSDPNM